MEGDKSGPFDSVNIPKHMQKYAQLLEYLKKLSLDNMDDTLGALRHSFFHEDYDEVAAILVYTSTAPLYDSVMAEILTYKLCIEWNHFNYAVLRVFASMESILPYTKYIRSLFQRGMWTFSKIQESLQDVNGYELVFAKEIVENCPQDDKFDKLTREYRKNDWKLYNEIIECGFPLNELGYAIKNDNLPLLQELASKEDFDYDQKILQEHFGSHERTLISTAAYYGSINCFKFLLVNKAKIDSSTAECAIMHGNLEIIKLSIEQLKDHSCLLPAAVLAHRDDLFVWISENFSDTKQASLYDCVRSLNYKALLYYIEKQSMSKDYQPSLCVAAQMGIVSMCRVLIENGADTKATMGLKDTALHLATRCQHFYVVSFLCSHGADSNLRNEIGKTPYDIADDVKNENIRQFLSYNGGKPARLVEKMNNNNTK
ncbi:hypothetical protein TVAG_277660 [Trichomonas vaginalis G3]|uniref:Uncharacterized protein n=2 Tax=Trichomonas vaginalis (strain ATCC PRA-98 / G3) TaxID=412133 RepID=A2FF27_TRIV3|nr:spectrin binding [Trichomonas vaginalis G3]EAX96485.1 hypothetical protein TVAG_277660 [Trichomonas vaginalis G3]KAI5552094.1 spectrin binding [Trichomonas vaginalis G3]|eukprot:XP_001309415.1 hypothetical protein [Trichomonas vaginalis G3]